MPWSSPDNTHGSINLYGLCLFFYYSIFLIAAFNRFKTFSFPKTSAISNGLGDAFSPLKATRKGHSVSPTPSFSVSGFSAISHSLLLGILGNLVSKRSSIFIISSRLDLICSGVIFFPFQK